MKYQFAGKNVTITQGMEEHAIKKLQALEKFFIVKDAVCRITVSIEPDAHKVEINIPTQFGLVRSEARNRDYYDAVDDAANRIGEQIRKAKAKLTRRHRDSLSASFALEEIEDSEEEELVRTKNIEIDTIDLDTAIAEMELLGHSFYIYRDDEDDKVAVVYKRNNGGYGLIEVDN